jgi:hypothetical protein
MLEFKTFTSVKPERKTQTGGRSRSITTSERLQASADEDEHFPV